MFKEILRTILKKHNMESFQYIVHRIDEVAVGEGRLSEEEGIFKDCERILEVHIFDGKIELFGRRVGNQLEFYEPLIYNGEEDKDWNKRSYILEEKFNGIYDCINIAEHIEYDPNHHLAYIDKTIILSLGKGRVNNELQ